MWQIDHWQKILPRGLFVLYLGRKNPLIECIVRTQI